MSRFRRSLLAVLAFLFFIAGVDAFAAHTSGSDDDPGVEKTNAYVGCINQLSARAHDSHDRYFSWVDPKTGPTGREKVIYGVYTIYETHHCRDNVEHANTLAPRDEAIEAAANAYVAAVVALEPLLKEADDYYTQEDYKDDRMAKGRALHPKLVAAWDAFAAADRRLRDGVEAINDRRAATKLAAIEKSEGKAARYYVEAAMIGAKRVLRAEDADKPDPATIEQAVADYETVLKGAEALASTGGGAKIGSMFLGSAKSFLATSKQLMRRLRDHTAYSHGDRMLIDAGSGWMVEGSPQRLLRDYNQLVDGYNGGANL